MFDGFTSSSGKKSKAEKKILLCHLTIPTKIVTFLLVNESS